MREILFRGKRIDNGKWVEGYLRFIYVDNPKKASIYDSKTVRNYDVDYETVGQYTGLKNKNGVKIFEGDIVIGKKGYAGSPHNPIWEQRFVVKYEYGRYKELCDTDYYEFEVIGNIHDGGFDFDKKPETN